MFYSVDLLSIRKNRKGRLPQCWLAATVKNHKVLINMLKKEIKNFKVDCACDDIIDGLTGNESVPRLSLYLSAQLFYGAVRIFKAQVDDLYEKTLVLLCNTSFSMPSKKKKSKETKHLDVQSIDIPIDNENRQILDFELQDLDMERVFGNYDQTDKHLLVETDEHEKNRFVDPIDSFPILPSQGINFKVITNELSRGQQTSIVGEDIEQSGLAGSSIENNEHQATIEKLPQEAEDDAIQRIPAESGVENSEYPATPKRKFRRQHNETPSKRKRVSITETARSPQSGHSVRQSLINTLKGIEYNIEANTAQTDNLDSQIPSTVHYSPPTESTGEQPQQTTNKENIYPVQPILEFSEASTIAADEPVNDTNYPSESIDPEQPLNLLSPRVASIPPEEQRQDNEQAVAGQSMQEPIISDQESQFILSELDSSLMNLSSSRRRSRKDFMDQNKQINIRYRSDSNALDKIYTRKIETCLPNVRGKKPANLLLSEPLVGLKIGSRGNQVTCIWSGTLHVRFLSNIQKPCINEFDFDQPHHRRDEFVNKTSRRSRIHQKDSTLETRPTTPMPLSPSHSQRQIDKQLMPPPSAPIVLPHSNEQHSDLSSRGFPKPIELAASPRQVRQRSQPSTVDPEMEIQLPQVEPALPTHGSTQPLVADQVPGDPEALPLDIEMQVDQPTQQPEVEDANLQFSSLIFMTPDEFYELLEELWAILIEFEEQPKLPFNDVFVIGQISVLEVLKYLKYLLVFEQKLLLYLEQEKPCAMVYICKLEELEDDN